MKIDKTNIIQQYNDRFEDMKMELEKYTANDFIQDESFQRYYFELDEQDVEFWEGWASANPHKSGEIQAAKKFLSLLQFDIDKLPEADFQIELQKLKKQIQTLPHSKNGEKPATGKQVSLFTNWTSGLKKLAAVVLPLLIAASAFYFYQLQKEGEQGLSELPAEKSFIEKSVPMGQKLTFNLPDGSTVKLNSGSSFKIPNDFNQQKREVYLEGEAFFEVAKDAEKPFIVTAGEVTTTVLGTSFGVRSFSTDNTMHVAVLEGMVSVNKKQYGREEFKMVLEPSEMVYYTPSTKNLRKGSFDYNEIIGWKDGLLHFKKADFQQIVGQLERWYGVEITVTNPQKVYNRPFTGSYKNESLGDVLKGISYVLGFEYTIKDNNVVIH